MLYPSAEDFLAHRAALPLWPARHADHRSARTGGAASSRDRNARAWRSLPSGLAAISAAILSVVRAGDHVLVTDSVYGPTRAFCDQMLTRLGVTRPITIQLIGAGIATLMHAEHAGGLSSKSPGSLTFEMQDVPAIAEAAHAKGALVLMDNTWATPLYFRALDFGVDLSIHAGTKYLGGHSDVMLGTVAANSATMADLRELSCA